MLRFGKTKVRSQNKKMLLTAVAVVFILSGCNPDGTPPVGNPPVVTTPPVECVAPPACAPKDPGTGSTPPVVPPDPKPPPTPPVVPPTDLATLRASGKIGGEAVSPPELGGGIIVAVWTGEKSLIIPSSGQNYEVQDVSLDAFNASGDRIWSKKLDTGVASPQAYLSFLDDVIYVGWKNIPSCNCEGHPQPKSSLAAYKYSDGEVVMSPRVVLNNGVFFGGVAATPVGIFGIVTITEGVFVRRFDLLTGEAAEYLPIVVVEGRSMFPYRIIADSDSLYLIGNSYDRDNVGTAALSFDGAVRWTTIFQSSGSDFIDTVVFGMTTVNNVNVTTVNLTGRSSFSVGPPGPINLKYLTVDGTLVN